MNTPTDRPGRGRLADEVCRRLADEIVLGALAAGTRLDEVTLANRFGVSRTPVREALKQLTATGLVVYRPNRGSVVAAPDPQQLDCLFEAIAEVEAVCARHAAVRMTEAQRGMLRTLHAEGRRAMQDCDLDRYDGLNRSLHQCIVSGAHNPVLADTAAALRHRVAPFRRTQFRNLERIAESFAEHSAIVEAVLGHDALAAQREMRGHLLSARVATGRLGPAWAQAPAEPRPAPRDLLVQRTST